MSQEWNAQNYDAQHAFVWRAGEGIFEWLAPQTNERILDLGCGTGHLTARIAAVGAQVVGLDASAQMLASAREQFPGLRWMQADARDFSFKEPFDAVFSNAALHWISREDTPRVLDNVARALQPEGRFVFEMGGKGNIAAISAALERAIERETRRRVEADNFFPSLAEYASLLEAGGFSVFRAELFPRPTPLENGEDGLRGWLQTFRGYLLEPLPVKVRESVIAHIEDDLRSALWDGERWTAPYVRLRIMARKNV